MFSVGIPLRIAGSPALLRVDRGARPTATTVTEPGIDVLSPHRPGHRDLDTRRGPATAHAGRGRSPGDRREGGPGHGRWTRAMDELDAKLHRIGQHHFRAKFRLRGRDRAVVDLRGITTVRRHAEELVQRRLAPAQPRNDGRQTPYRGHPVFVAQHATATCCRTCLARWHDIPAGHALDDAERGYVVEAICRWITGQYAPHHPPP